MKLQKHETQKHEIIVLTVFFALMISVFLFPSAVFAQENEPPGITAVYYDEQGKAVDGNKLLSGNYRMELVLSCFENLSEMEFTASYSSNVVIDVNSVVCSVADNNSDISSLCKVGNGSIILCVVSLNEDFSNIASDGVTVFSANITVSADTELDMENVITENESADYTFVENNYNDINKSSVPYVYNCYGFDKSQTADYAGTVTYMLFDMSPELPKAFDVSGKIVAMIDPNNPNSVTGANPVSDVDVIVNGQVAASTDESGNYSIQLPNGRNEVVFDYQYGPARTVVIHVNGAAVNVGSITIVTADLDNDGSITFLDTGLYQDSLIKSNLMGDIDKDGSVSFLDTGIYQAFYQKGLDNIYPEIVIN